MEDRVVLAPEGMAQACRHDRLLFRYYKDRYAAMLLENVLSPRLLLRELRAGPYGRLLDRPALKALAASKGDGFLHRDDLATLWPYEVETYVLSFAAWGSRKRRDRRWNQTSRPCRQLVLQLNFSRQHDAQYQRLVSNAAEMPFTCGFHPTNSTGRNTLAWSRIDIDFGSGEALIDEVQNDWLREVSWDLARAARGEGSFAESKSLKIYAESVLAPHAVIWSEAVLAATLDMLSRVLGIGRVWFHDFETGCEIKKLSKSFAPPRSLYTDLPRKFCFERTADVPEFILPVQPKRLRRKLERGDGRFWRLDTSPWTSGCRA